MATDYTSRHPERRADAIIVTDLNFTITGWNRAAEALYGWRAVEAIGQPADVLLGTIFVDSRPEYVLQRILAYGDWEGEITQRGQDGTTHTLLLSRSVISDGTNTPINIVSVHHDITEHKQATGLPVSVQEQLDNTEQLESIVQLVGGIAHNFNNLLMIILGYCDLMRNTMRSDDPLRAELEQITQAGNRAATLTRQLLAFGRKQMFTPQAIDLNSLITNLLPVLRQWLSANITFATNFQTGLWQVIADPGQIKQVIIDLVLNARDAMPSGGMISILTRNVGPDEHTTFLASGAPSISRVLLVLTDSGTGMDAQTKSQLFEPFFTTKAPGQGTGMGLASVYGTVTQSGGSILVDSQPGFGSSFMIYMPAHTTAALTLASPTPSDAKKENELNELMVGRR